MGGLIKSEYRKLISTQVWFWLLLTSVALTVIQVIATIASDSDEALPGDVHNIMTAAGSCFIALFVLGVLGITTEYRYQTVTPTVLATPNRWALVSAKVVTYVLVAVIYSVVCILIELAIALPWLSARNVHVSLGSQVWPLLSNVVVVALLALIGLGTGAVVRNQIVAVTVGLIFLLLIESLFLLIPKVRNIYPYLPGGASSAVQTPSNGDRIVNHVHLLPIWGGVVVLAVWGLGMAIIGAGYTMNRDIT